MTNNNQRAREVAGVAVQPSNRPINKLSVKTEGSNFMPMSEEKIELLDTELIQNHNDNGSNSEVFVECATACQCQHGFISNKLNFKIDKSTQTVRKFNHDEKIVADAEEGSAKEENDAEQDFNYHLNGPELLTMTKNSNSKQSRVVRPRKIDCRNNLLLSRRKFVPNNVGLMTKPDMADVATVNDRKKVVRNNASDVLKPEINQTRTGTVKKWPNRKTNTNCTMPASIAKNIWLNKQIHKKILNGPVAARKDVADAAHKMTHADEKNHHQYDRHKKRN